MLNKKCKIMKKKVDETKTLKYAVAFHFLRSSGHNFLLRGKMYQHISTVYDRRDCNSDSSTLEVVYNYHSCKYEVFNLNTKIGNEEILILNF